MSSNKLGYCPFMDNSKCIYPKISICLSVLMSGEKLFYKYQSLKAAVDDDGKVIKDENSNVKIYSIQNLANNQLYFNDPIKFNDPFDCKFVIHSIGTRDQWIDYYKSIGHNHRKAVMRFNEKKKLKILIEEQNNLYSYDYIKDLKFNIKQGYLKKEDYVVYPNSNRESRNQIGIDMNDYLRSKALPSISCFSDTERSILMWSHYADYHQGICISLRSYKRTFKLNENWVVDLLFSYGLAEPEKEYYLFDLYSPTTNKLVVNNIFYEVEYNDELPESVNFFDQDNVKMFKFLRTKFSDWVYENEYRLMIGVEYLENNVLKYKKSDLEGVVFGLKINYNNAKLVYNTVKENYLDKGFNVNFYEAKEVVGKYEVEPELISDIEKYLSDLQ